MRIITLVGFIILPVCVGAISYLITGKNMALYGQFTKPPFSPPSWLFSVAWTILYILMGVASYLVFSHKSDTMEYKFAMTLYIVQLILNFIWSPLFFNMRWYLGALVCLLLMWICILFMMVYFSQIYKPAAWLMLPYLLWSTFAAYLNAGVYMLNK